MKTIKTDIMPLICFAIALAGCVLSMVIPAVTGFEEMRFVCLAVCGANLCLGLTTLVASMTDNRKEPRK